MTVEDNSSNLTAWLVLVLCRWSVDKRSNMLAISSASDCVKLVEISSGAVEERETIPLVGEDMTVIHAKFLTAWDMLVLAKDNTTDEVSSSL